MSKIASRVYIAIVNQAVADRRVTCLPGYGDIVSGALPAQRRRRGPAGFACTAKSQVSDPLNRGRV